MYDHRCAIDFTSICRSRRLGPSRLSASCDRRVPSLKVDPTLEWLTDCQCQPDVDRSTSVEVDWPRLRLLLSTFLFNVHHRRRRPLRARHKLPYAHRPHDYSRLSLSLRSFCLRSLSDLDMRVSTLSAVCAAALVLPASSVPLAMTKDIALDVATLTVALNGPTEVPDVPVPSAPIPTVPTGGRKSQANSLSGSKLLKFPRAADFRQADYGVSPNVTFAMAPVHGVEATPSDAAPAATNSLRRRSEDDWEDARLKPDDYSAAGSPSGNLSDAATDAGDDTPADTPSVPANPAPPVKFGDLQNPSPNNLPLQPDLSDLSQVLGKGIQGTGEARYRSAYAAHDLLGATAENAKPAMSPSTAVSKTPTQLTKLSHGSGNPSGGLLRRVLEPARYLAAPLRRALDDLTKAFANPMKGNDLMGKKDMKGLGAHTFELNTEPVLPSPADPALNMSDPYVAQEEARRQHAGVVNLDSNRPAPPPPAPLTTDVPLNGTATNGTATATGALDDGAKDAKDVKDVKDGEKGAQAVKLDKAAKNATVAA
ncbi:hypothetical protein GY45DRAFT_867761 [Cubamyces sp. BRFM 1775]|nr:hypothetical protein GY45DRAFT_867761 [Cubamyces sp. BRFM 1775]